MRKERLQIKVLAFLFILISHQVCSVAVSHDSSLGGRRLNGSGHKSRHRNAHEVNANQQGNSSSSDSSQAISTHSDSSQQQSSSQQSQGQGQGQGHSVASSWQSTQSAQSGSKPSSADSSSSSSKGVQTDPIATASSGSSHSSSSTDSGYADDHVSAWSTIPKDPFTWDGETSWEWDNPRTLYFEPLAGLGNRLRALASAVVMAKEYGVGLKVIWREEPIQGLNPGFNSTWGDLFTEPNLRLADGFPGIDAPVSHEMDLYRAENRDESIMPTVEAHQCMLHNPHSHAEMVKAMETGWKMLSTGEEVLCVRGDVWLTEAGEKEGKFFFRLLKPSAMVQSMIDKFKYETEWEENHMVGIHVRRGDLTIWGKNNDHKKVKSLIPIDSYVSAMKAQKALAQGVRRVRFFLATDDAEAEAEIKAAFTPGYVFSYPKHNLSRNAVQGIQEALTDVMLLADCPILIGTYYSSYSETAKMMGWPFYIQVGWDLKKLSIETKIEKDDPEEEDEVMKKLL